MKICISPIESPAMSPDLENRRGALHFPEIVRGWSINSRLFAPPSKPDLCPDQPVSPKITARYEIIPRGEGVLHRAVHDARLVSPRAFQYLALEVLIPVRRLPGPASIPLK